MKRVGRWFAVAFAALFGVALAQAQVYESKEKSGVPVFSDQPSSGSREITLPKPNVSDAPMPSVQTPPPPSMPAYSQMTIVSPGPDGTVHSNTGAFTVTVSVTPALNSSGGDRFMVKLDGTTLPGRYSDPNISLTTEDVAGAAVTDNIQHQLEVVVVDTGGSTLIAATPVKFYLRRAIVHKRELPERQIHQHMHR